MRTSPGHGHRHCPGDGPASKSSLRALGALLAVVLVACAAFASVACGSDETSREPEQTDANADNPAAVLGLGDKGLGDKSPGQPSPWDHLEAPVKRQSVPTPPVR